MEDLKKIITALIIASILGLSSLVFALNNKTIELKSGYGYIVESLNEIKQGMKELKQEIRDLK